MEQAPAPSTRRVSTSARLRDRIAEGVSSTVLLVAGFQAVDVDAEDLLCSSVFADLEARLFFVVGGDQEEQASIERIFTRARGVRDLEAKVCGFKF